MKFLKDSRKSGKNLEKDTLKINEGFSSDKKRAEKKKKDYYHNLEILKTYLISKISLEKDISHKELSQLLTESIKKFRVLQYTFLRIDSTLVKEILTYVNEVRKIFLKREEKLNEQLKPKEEENPKLRDVKKLKSESKRLLSAYYKNEQEIAIIKESVDLIFGKRLEVLIRANKLKEEIYRSEIIMKKRKSYEMMDNIRRKRGINEDVLEYLKEKSHITNSTINPIHVLKARLLGEQKSLEHATKEFGIEYQKLEKLKEKKQYIRSSLAININLLVKCPDFLKSSDITIQECIILVLKAGIEFFPKSIGGDYTNPEKEFIVQSAKLNLKYKKSQDFAQKEAAQDLKLIEEEEGAKYIRKNSRDFGETSDPNEMISKVCRKKRVEEIFSRREKRKSLKKNFIELNTPVFKKKISIHYDSQLDLIDQYLKLEREITAQLIKNLSDYMSQDTELIRKIKIVEILKRMEPEMKPEQYKQFKKLLKRQEKMAHFVLKKYKNSEAINKSELLSAEDLNI